MVYYRKRQHEFLDRYNHPLNVGDIVIYNSSTPVIGRVTELKQVRFLIEVLHENKQYQKGYMTCKDSLNAINLTAMGIDESKLEEYFKNY